MYKNGTTVHVVRWRANGARHFRQFVSRQEAEAFEASVRPTRANGGTPPADPGATVADLVALYADDRRDRARAAALRSLRRPTPRSKRGLLGRRRGGRRLGKLVRVAARRDARRLVLAPGRWPLADRRTLTLPTLLLSAQT